MSGIEQPEKIKKDKSKIILISIIVIIAIAAGYKIYTDYESNQLMQAEFEATKTELSTKLDSIGTELSYRITEIAELGGNIDSLVFLKDSIIMERDQLQRTRRANKAIIQRLDRKVTGYEELLLAKDVEIKELKVINTELLAENNTLKVEQNTLNSTIIRASEREKDLKNQISLASKLRAENIKIFNINSRGKEKEGGFRSRQAEKIKVTFNIANNEVAPVSGHQIMIQLVDPAGNVVFDVARGSGSFQVNGKEQFFTSIQEILFDNTKQELSFVYDKGSEFEKGDHKIIILSDTYEIGSVNFNVR
jgi:cell division protein ZapB